MIGKQKSDGFKTIAFLITGFSFLTEIMDRGSLKLPNIKGIQSQTEASNVNLRPVHYPHLPQSPAR